MGVAGSPGLNVGHTYRDTYHTHINNVRGCGTQSPHVRREATWLVYEAHVGVEV